jgi:hypothetical protein
MFKTGPTDEFCSNFHEKIISYMKGKPDRNRTTVNKRPSPPSTAEAMACPTKTSNTWSSTVNSLARHF